MTKFSINDLVMDSQVASESHLDVDDPADRMKNILNLIAENINKMKSGQALDQKLRIIQPPFGSSLSINMIKMLTEKTLSNQFSANFIGQSLTEEDEESESETSITTEYTQQGMNPSEKTFRPISGRKAKRIRTAFSPNQLISLESAFEKNRYVVGQERRDLAISLKLTETQVKVWFQNRRTKYKRSQTRDPSGNTQNFLECMLLCQSKKNETQYHTSHDDSLSSPLRIDSVSKKFVEANCSNASEKLFFNAIYNKSSDLLNGLRLNKK